MRDFFQKVFCCTSDKKRPSSTQPTTVSHLKSIFLNKFRKESLIRYMFVINVNKNSLPWLYFMNTRKCIP
jgi:hypothetical protein